MNASSYRYHISILYYAGMIVGDIVYAKRVKRSLNSVDKATELQHHRVLLFPDLSFYIYTVSKHSLSKWPGAHVEHSHLSIDSTSLGL